MIFDEKINRIKKKLLAIKGRLLTLDYRIAQIESAELPRRFRELSIRITELEKQNDTENR